MEGKRETIISIENVAGDKTDGQDKNKKPEVEAMMEKLHKGSTGTQFKNLVQQLQDNTHPGPGPGDGGDKGPSTPRNSLEKEKQQDDSDISDDEDTLAHYSNFNDLVMFDDDGRPYIDANKLIYSPQLRRKHEYKEKLSWYYADYVFIICNMLSLVTSAYMFAHGFQSITWSESIGSVNHRDPSNGNGNGSILRFKTSSNQSSEITPGVIGTILACLGLLNTINALLGFWASSTGSKMWLKQHAILDIVGIVLQLLVSLIVMWFGTCDSFDMLGFQEGFEYMVRSFVEPNRPRGVDADEQYYAKTVLDQIQVSMQCCGASNWTDYINSRVTYLNASYLGGRTYDPVKSQKWWPYSCCKSWWVRNIDCTTGIHVWLYPNTSRIEVKKFRERIYEIGCAPRIWLSCKRLLFGMGQGLFVVNLMSGLVLVAEFFSIRSQIRSVNKALKDVKEQGVKLMSRGSIDSGGEEEETALSPEEANRLLNNMPKKSLGDSKSVRLKDLDEFKSKLAPPTEDEIQYIKSRTHYTQFEMRMRHTQIGKLLTTARKAMIPKGEDGEGGEEREKSPSIIESEQDFELRQLQKRARQLSIESIASLQVAKKGKSFAVSAAARKQSKSVGLKASAAYAEATNIQRKIEQKKIAEKIEQQQQTSRDTKANIELEKKMSIKKPEEDEEPEQTTATEARKSKVQQNLESHKIGLKSVAQVAQRLQQVRKSGAPATETIIPHSKFEGKERSHEVSDKLKQIFERANMEIVPAIVNEAIDQTNSRRSVKPDGGPLSAVPSVAAIAGVVVPLVVKKKKRKSHPLKPPPTQEEMNQYHHTYVAKAKNAEGNRLFSEKQHERPSLGVGILRHKKRVWVSRPSKKPEEPEKKKKGVFVGPHHDLPGKAAVHSEDWKD